MKVDIDAEGARTLMARLRLLGDDSLKILQREVRQAMDQMAKDARAAVPSQALRNWGTWNYRGRDLSWNAGKVRSGFRPGFRARKNAQGFQEVTGQVANTTAQGAIYILAGSGARGGDIFATVLRNKHGAGIWKGGAGRAFGPAFDKNVDDARDKVSAAVQRAADKVT